MAARISVLVLVLLAGVARADPLADLAGDDPRRAVETVEAAGDAADADEMFVAARACEDKLLDPGRAFALYARLEAAHPDARVVVAARKRMALLAGEVGARGEHAALARRFAAVVAHADEREDTLREADELAAADWPGAARVALWTAGWVRRSGDLGEATKRYRAIGARWPEYAHEALLGEAGVALDAHEWARAEELAAALPIETPADERVQADIERMVRRGRLLARLYALSWVVVALVALGLVGSLVSARRGARLAWSVPAEVLFAAPVVAILVVVTYAERRVFAPTVATIAGGGLVLAGLSGLALDALRARGRSARRRGLAHAAACTLAVAALAYISVSQDGVMDALIETVRSGPEG